MSQTRPHEHDRLRIMIEDPQRAGTPEKEGVGRLTHMGGLPFLCLAASIVGRASNSCYLVKTLSTQGAMRAGTSVVATFLV